MCSLILPKLMYIVNVGENVLTFMKERGFFIYDNFTDFLCTYNLFFRGGGGNSKEQERQGFLRSTYYTIYKLAKKGI